MGRLDDKKKAKKEALLTAAFSLFTKKGINETSILDITRRASLAKGTFYLYFRDKYEIRDTLIIVKASQVFNKALQKVDGNKLETLEEHVIALVEAVVDQLDEDKTLLEFIAKNLSWGVFHRALLQEDETYGESFYDRYYALLHESGRHFRNPDLMLFMILELVNSTCYSVILKQEPVTLTELKPELGGVICDIIRRQEE